jgi:hypothetical protein
MPRNDVKVTLPRVSLDSGPASPGAQHTRRRDPAKAKAAVMVTAVARLSRSPRAPKPNAKRKPTLEVLGLSTSSLSSPKFGSRQALTSRSESVLSTDSGGGGGGGGGGVLSGRRRTGPLFAADVTLRASDGTTLFRAESYECRLVSGTHSLQLVATRPLPGCTCVSQRLVFEVQRERVHKDALDHCALEISLDEELANVRLRAPHRQDITQLLADMASLSSDLEPKLSGQRGLFADVSAAFLGGGDSAETRRELRSAPSTDDLHRGAELSDWAEKRVVRIGSRDKLSLLAAPAGGDGASFSHKNGGLSDSDRKELLETLGAFGANTTPVSPQPLRRSHSSSLERFTRAERERERERKNGRGSGSDSLRLPGKNPMGLSASDGAVGSGGRASGSGSGVVGGGGHSPGSSPKPRRGILKNSTSPKK